MRWQSASRSCLQWSWSGSPPPHLSLSALGGGEGQGEVGALRSQYRQVRSSARHWCHQAHLTPALSAQRAEREIIPAPIGMREC